MVDFLTTFMAGKLPEWNSALGALATVVGLAFGWKQIKLTKDIAQLQFEDALEKEYRELVSDIPTKALLDSDLDDAEYAQAFYEFFRYFDLSNRQVELIKEGRIGDATWNNWRLCIRLNMSQPAFKIAWGELKIRTEDHVSEFFSELRRLESFAYGRDLKVENNKT